MERLRESRKYSKNYTILIQNNQYNKFVKRRSECGLYKLTGGQAGRRTDGQTDGQTDRQAASCIERLRL
jgi:hypothetical protein